jgi:hypothetical protein
MYYIQTRPAAMAALDPMGLAGEGGVVSETTPGVFIQVKLINFCKELNR